MENITNGKDAIINKIIYNSEALSKAILEEADEKVDSLVNTAKTMAEDYRKKNIPQIEMEKKAIISRKESIAEIEAKKIVLFTKQEMLDKVFSMAFERICKSDNKIYADFLKHLIDRYGEDGDLIIISENDAGLITEKFINEISLKKKINLKLSKGYGNFNAGLIIASNGYDKNLTIKTLLHQIKDKYQTDIANKLFGQGE